MAPIEPDLSNSNLRPIAIFASYLALATGLTTYISRNVLYGAFAALPPSQATRFRTSKRRRHVVAFALLAALSLAVTWWHMFAFFSLSYRSWAHEMGQPLPERVWGKKGVWGQEATGLALGRWLSDTELFREAWEIGVERSRRYWWCQQIILGAAAWAVYLSVEGRRRNIRHLWAFMLLAQLVAVSVAMNLFFVAILLTAVPLTPRANEAEPPTKTPRHRRKKSSATDETALATIEKKARPTLSSIAATARRFLPPLPMHPHHHTWEPNALGLFAPLFVTYVCAFLLPYSTGTPLFMPLLLISHVALFQPLYPQFLMPEAFGSTSPTHLHRYLPRLITVFSVSLHFKQTVASLLDADPGAYEHRHTKYLAYARLPHESERTRTYRSASAVGRVLGALSDHPAVSSVGWDVLMCGISLGIWAASRGLQPDRILAALGFGEIKNRPHPKKRSASSSKSALAKALDATPAVAKTPAAQSTRRKKKGVKTEDADDDPFVDDASKEKSDDKDFKTSATTDPAIDEETLGLEADLPANTEAAAVSWAAFALGGLGASAAGVLFS